MKEIVNKRRELL